MDPSYRNPFAEEFNVGYQWQLNESSVIEAEYTHTLGLHSNVDVNINPTDPVTGVRPLSAAFAPLFLARARQATAFWDALWTIAPLAVRATMA